MVCADGYACLTTLGAIGQLPDRWEAENDDFEINNGTPVVVDGIVLGVTTRDGLTALALNDGLKTLWTFNDGRELRGFGYIMARGGLAFLQLQSGAGYVLEFDREGCDVIFKGEICGQTLVHPALDSHALYVRDDHTLKAFNHTTR
jgi:outer membrane protein assembly factor BamB